MDNVVGSCLFEYYGIMSKTVAIHQPNFFPWMGYFNKLHRCDIFILLDDVQFVKKGGTWTNRVKLLIGGQPQWITAPVDRGFHGVRKINEMRLLDTERWLKKTLKSIELSYKKHPFFEDTMEVVAPLLANTHENIAEYNSVALRAISERLGFDAAKMRLSSGMKKEGSSNELLASLTLAAGGDEYLCGGGADGYQDESVFRCLGVTLTHQRFVHPVYPQKGEQDFIPGLSIIDSVMNIGWEKTGDFVRQ